MPDSTLAYAYGWLATISMAFRSPWATSRSGTTSSRSFVGGDPLDSGPALRLIRGDPTAGLAPAARAY
ncbi:MAG: hypothetical protein IPK00_14940 [Deltaproteobacteria bacterium]|nr:hypothetical protein [Deltaproteobacteria bacterium]